MPYSFRKRFLAIGVCAAVLFGSCASPLVPKPKLPREDRIELPDGEVIAQLRADWERLQQVQMASQERQVVIKNYNDRLLLLLRRVRYDMLKHKNKRALAFQVVHDGVPVSRPLRSIYDDIVPAIEVNTSSLEEHYVMLGVGVPLVGIIPAEKIQTGDQLATFQARGTVSTLTAVMEFPAGESKPVLRLIPRHGEEQVRIGKLFYPLAGDFSAPMELYWNLTQVKKGRILGLLSPQKLRDTTGLTCMERYNPKKIPVILTHGLASSASTFANLVNRLISNPTIRHNYQFWYFNYPTGMAWTLSAAEYRKALAHARNHFDPKHKNANWDRMVVVGHSMGGLITHYSQCVEPWRLLEHAPLVKSKYGTYLDKRYVEAPLPNASLESMRSVYFFNPVKAGCVIYMATPHRGAPMARNRFVLFLTRLVNLPQDIVTEAINIVTLQEDNLIVNPGRLTSWFTSVGQLSPDSYSIRGLAPLAVQNVPTHSIIGDRGRHDTPHSSDGVVPYWSSHIPWGSETIVPASHSVQDISETAAEVQFILLENLKAPKRPVSKRPIGPFSLSRAH